MATNHGDLTYEEIFHLKPGDMVTVVGNSNWSEEAQFMVGYEYPIKEIQNGMIRLEIADYVREIQPGWSMYDGTWFENGWLTRKPGKRVTRPVATETQCSKCGRWGLHALSCPEMGLV